MKRTRIDKLGRIVIPIAFRRCMGVDYNSELIIECEGRNLLIMPADTMCRICGKCIDIGMSMPICKACVARIKEMKI